jgi:hypothetical protein
MDSDPIIAGGQKPDDLNSVILDVMSHVQYRLFAIMFIVFIVLSSDVFIKRVLDKFNNAVSGSTTTSWGTVLQGVFLVLACLISDILIKQNIF